MRWEQAMRGMVDESVLLRIAFLILLISVRVARWPSRSQTGWQQNWPAMKRHPIDTALLLAVSLLWLVAVVLFLVAPRFMEPFRLPIPGWLRWCGFAGGMGATALIAWADRSLGKNLSVTLQIKAGHELVTSGPYRWIRHPIYAAGLLFSIAMGLMAANYLLATLFVVPMAALATARIGAEERMMQEHFGPRYLDYMQRTGRLLPRLRRVE